MADLSSARRQAEEALAKVGVCRCGCDRGECCAATYCRALRALLAATREQEAALAEERDANAMLREQIRIKEVVFAEERRKREQAERLVREVAEGGVETEDEQHLSVTAQIDRETWAEVKRFAATAPAPNPTSELAAAMNAHSLAEMCAPANYPQSYDDGYQVPPINCGTFADVIPAPRTNILTGDKTDQDAAMAAWMRGEPIPRPKYAAAPAPQPGAGETVLSTVAWVLNDALYKAPEQIAGCWRAIWAPKLREALDAMPVGVRPAPPAGDGVPLSELSGGEWTWRRVALRVGEEFARSGPTGYYDFGPTEWQDWMLARIYETRPPAGDGVSEAAERLRDVRDGLSYAEEARNPEFWRALDALLAALDAKGGAR